jgi:hypothetical protein
MKRKRCQISLGTFLLLLTVIALAWSHIVTSRRLADTHKQLADYRYQYGHLVVDDPTRPHVLAYAQQQNPWKWHANFPKGKSYKMMCGVGDIPVDGLPDVTRLHHVQETWITGTGQNTTMFVSAIELKPSSLEFSIGCDGSQTVSQIMPTADVYTRSVFNSFSVGPGDTFVADPDEPFVLFYQIERKANSAGASAGSANGVVVWVVPIR